MPILFSSLPTDQQALVAARFHDVEFGNDPALYAYDTTAAGLLTGQRTPLHTPGAKKQNPRGQVCHVLTSGPLVLTDQAAAHFARRIIKSGAAPMSEGALPESTRFEGLARSTPQASLSTGGAM